MLESSEEDLVDFEGNDLSLFGRCHCGRPGVSWLGYSECEDCFDEH